MSVKYTYKPHGSKARDILRRQIENARLKKKHWPGEVEGDVIHGTLEIGELKAAGGEQVNTRKEWAW